MTDIIIESLRAVVVGVILIVLVKGERSHQINKVQGWRILLSGFILIFLATLIDITDNFPALNQFVFVGDTPVQAFLEKVVGYLIGFMLISIGIWRWLPKIIEHQNMTDENLEKAIQEVKVLQGFLPICSACKQIRDDKGYWKQIEEYITEHSEAQFSHGICPTCFKRLYPKEYEQLKIKKAQEKNCVSSVND